MIIHYRIPDNQSGILFFSVKINAAIHKVDFFIIDYCNDSCQNPEVFAVDLAMGFSDYIVNYNIKWYNIQIIMGCFIKGKLSFIALRSFILCDVCL